MSQTSKIFLSVIITAIVVGGSFYFWQQQEDKTPQPIAETTPPATQTETPPPIVETATPTTQTETPNPNSSTIKIMVPENYNLYQQKMTKFAQEGGNDPLETIKFIEKKITVPYTDDIIKASAQAAAEQIAPGGGPLKASIAYFKVQNKTAYVVLDIDLDSWAGASVSKAIIHPLVKNTLMQFPEINSVVFDYAPGDE